MLTEKDFFVSGSSHDGATPLHRSTGWLPEAAAAVETVLATVVHDRCVSDRTYSASIILSIHHMASTGPWTGALTA